MLPNFKLYYKATVIKTIWYWHKNRSTDQWNRTECPYINSSIYGQLIYNKGVLDIQFGNDSLFNSWCWQNWTATCQRIKLGYCLTPYTEVNSKWIGNLSKTNKTTKNLTNVKRKTNLDKFLVNFSVPRKNTGKSCNKKQTNKIITSQRQALLQRHSNQDNLVLAQEQAHRPVEQDRESRY